MSCSKCGHSADEHNAERGVCVACSFPCSMPDLALTEEAVQGLLEGTPVIVTWSGGNGPHRYVIAVDKYGQRHVWDGVTEQLRYYNPLRFVGREQYHTRVWLDEP